MRTASIKSSHKVFKYREVHVKTLSQMTAREGTSQLRGGGLLCLRGVNGAVMGLNGHNFWVL